MTNEEIARYCLQKPGAYEDFPFGLTPACYKVCGRIFLQLYPHPEGHRITVSCERGLAEMYRARFPGDVRPGYHCPDRLKPHMNTVCLNRSVEDALVFAMIDHSYARAVSKLTRAKRVSLAAQGGPNV